MPNTSSISLDSTNSFYFTGAYRYGYKGMEKDDQVKGAENSYTTEFSQFPWMSPYVGFDNNPIFYTDPYGLSAGGSPGATAEGDPDKRKPQHTESHVGSYEQKMQTITNELPEDFKDGDTHTFTFSEGNVNKVVYKKNMDGSLKESKFEEGYNPKYASNTRTLRDNTRI